MATIKSVSTLIVDGDWIESKDQSPEGIRLIQTGNVGVGEYLDKPSRAKYISEETFKRLNCTELDCGDILVSRLPDPIGRACVVPAHVGRAITAVDCTIIRLNPEKCDTQYFVQYTQSELYQNRLSQFFAGSTRTRISRKNLEQIEIPLPTITEQRSIASTMGKVDELIALRKEQLAKLDQMVKSRFIELFGDPDTNPLGWNEDVLSKHLEVIGGYAFKSDKFEDEGIPVLRIGNINSGQFLPVNMVYWNDDPTLGRYKMYPGDLVMSLTGTVGKDDYGNVCILGADYPEYYLNQRNAKLSLKPTLNAKYLSELLKFERIKRRLTGISRGVRQANISNKDILFLCVPIAPINLQQQFAAFVEQTDKSKLAIQQSLNKLELLKKSLMKEHFG